VELPEYRGGKNNDQAPKNKLTLLCSGRGPKEKRGVPVNHKKTVKLKPGGIGRKEEHDRKNRGWVRNQRTNLKGTGKKNFLRPPANGPTEQSRKKKGE